MQSKMTEIPEVGKTYKFYDDGKISHSRQYDATVLQIVTEEESKEIMFDIGGDNEVSLYDIYQIEVDNHLQGANSKVISGGSMEEGKPWLYARSTDFLIECSIPDYDEHNIWFVRTINGEWFSLEIQSFWQTGKLDVDGHLTKQLNNETN